MSSDKWWDGYKGEETVIFDDFKGSSTKLHDFQTIIDRYPVQVEVKGAEVDLHATSSPAPLRVVLAGSRS